MRTRFATIVKIIRNKRRFKAFSLFLALSLLLFCYTPSVFEVKRLSSCKLPRLDPFDKTLDKYRGIPKFVHCTNHSSLMYVNERGFLHVNESAILRYSLKSLSCKYFRIHRLDGDKKLKIDDGVTFEPPIFINSRIFRVVCNDEKRGKVYDFVHVNMAWNDSRTKNKDIRYETDKQLSVIFIGLDSISRSQAIRNLPMSFEYLTGNLSAFDFQGYTKVGMNTYPNLMPLLTGDYHYKFVMSSLLRLTYLDDVPFLWNDKKMRNYATYFSEDRLDLATFIEPRPGFNKAPTDYYYRPYLLAMDQYEPFIIEPLGKSNMYCYGNEDHASIQINHLKQFISKYSRRLKYAFFWKNGVNHDEHNYDFWDDKPLLELLIWLKSNGHLDRSVLVVGSDHGSRTSGIGSTHIGRMENNLPFFTMYIPEVLKRKYPNLPAMLEHNSRHLTTPFDIYKTIKAVINSEFTLNKRDSKIGQSLFFTIPEVRSCEDAGVPAQFCTCYEQMSIDMNTPVVIKLATFAVAHLNHLLRNHRALCQELFLHNITLAKVVYTAEGDTDRSRINRNPWFYEKMLSKWEPDESGRYIIVLYTAPNYGLIEFMIEYEKHPSYGRKEITVIGEPSRLNRYGNQSHCIKTKLLKQYCLCFDMS